MLSVSARSHAADRVVSFDERARSDEGAQLDTLLLTRTATRKAGALPLCGRPAAWLVSPRHAHITRDRFDRFHLYDVSRTGTWVNDVRVPARAPRRLADGDVITLGAPSRFEYEGEMVLNPYRIRFHQTSAPRPALAQILEQL